MSGAWVEIPSGVDGRQVVLRPRATVYKQRCACVDGCVYVAVLFVPPAALCGFTAVYREETIIGAIPAIRMQLIREKGKNM